MLRDYNQDIVTSVIANQLRKYSSVKKAAKNLRPQFFGNYQIREGIFGQFSLYSVEINGPVLKAKKLCPQSMQHFPILESAFDEPNKAKSDQFSHNQDSEIASFRSRDYELLLPMCKVEYVTQTMHRGVLDNAAHSLSDFEGQEKSELHYCIRIEELTNGLVIFLKGSTSKSTERFYKEIFNKFVHQKIPTFIKKIGHHDKNLEKDPQESNEAERIKVHPAQTQGHHSPRFIFTDPKYKNQYKIIEIELSESNSQLIKKIIGKWMLQIHLDRIQNLTFEYYSMVVQTEGVLVVIIGNGSQNLASRNQVGKINDSTDIDTEARFEAQKLIDNPSLLINLLPSLLKMIRNINLRQLTFRDPSRLLENVIYTNSAFYVQNLTKLLKVDTQEKITSTPAEVQFTFRSMNDQLQMSNMTQCYQAILEFLQSSTKVQQFDQNTKKKLEYLSEEFITSTRQLKDLKTSLTLSSPEKNCRLDKDIIDNLETQFEEIDDKIPYCVSHKRMNRECPLRINTLDLDLEVQERQRTRKENEDVLAEGYGFQNEHHTQVARTMKFKNKFKN